MTSQPDLATLYTEATQALRVKDYYHASDLLRQILKADVDYKDAAQLLARVIKLSRRRWYNDSRTWGALGALLLVSLGIYLFPILQDLYRQPAPAPVILPTGSPTQTIAPLATATATATSISSPTPIPLAWKRISLGQEFPRDTVTAFATDKNDPDVIYASMQNAGVYKTIDGGLSWRPAHNGLSNTQVESLLIDSQSTNILYAGTMDGVYKTEDGGENWFGIGDGTYLLMDYQDNSHLYARDENGIYETTDQGNTWTTTYFLNEECPSTVYTWAILPKEGNTIFIGSQDECGPGIYQSDDGGRTWKLLEMKNSQGIIAIAIGSDDQGAFSIYVKSQGWGENHGLYVSHNLGKNWSKISHSGCDLFSIDPDNLSHIFCGSGTGIFAIQGKGSPLKGIGLQTITPSAIYVDHYKGAERILVGATRHSTPFEDGIFVSADGGISWGNYNGGLGATDAELRLDPRDSSRIYLAAYYPSWSGGMACSIYRASDNGKNWSLIYFMNAYGWCGPTFDGANDLFLMEGNSWQRSQDGGEHWWWGDKQFRDSYGAWDAHFSLPAVSQSVSANPYIPGLIYAIGDEIYYSLDAGESWQSGTGSKDLGDARLFYKDEGQAVYAIGQTHQAYSTDKGVTWQACGQDMTASRSDMRLALDLGGSRLYLATPGQGVMISTDTCGSWQPSNNGLTNLFVNTLAVDPNNPNTIYAGTDGGAYISYDAGTNWGQVNDGLLGATVVYSIAVDADSNVYAATPYGIFKLEKK